MIFISYYCIFRFVVSLSFIDDFLPRLISDSNNLMNYLYYIGNNTPYLTQTVIANNVYFYDCFIFE